MTSLLATRLRCMAAWFAMRSLALRRTACVPPSSATYAGGKERVSFRALDQCPGRARIRIDLPVVRLPRSTRVTTASARALSPMLPAIHQPLAASTQKHSAATAVNGLSAFLTQTDFERLSPRHVRTVSS
jgi:hypothetical protein